MRSRANLCGVLSSLSAALTVAGCQTPPAVYELAEKTSSSAGIVQHHLAEVASQSRSLAETRSNHVVAMEAFNARLDATLKRELYMQQHSRASADWSEIKALMEQMATLRDQLLEIARSASISEADRRKEILTKHTDLNIYKTALHDTANALSALAKHESKSERAKFIGKFVGEVREDLDKSLKGSDATSKAAKGLADTIKKQFKDADPDVSAASGG
jgi:hypothetical protein